MSAYTIGMAFCLVAPYDFDVRRYLASTHIFERNQNYLALGVGVLLSAAIGALFRGHNGK